MSKKKKLDKNNNVKTDDILPYDSLTSNRGHDESNMYLDRTERKRKSLNFNEDPHQFNAPPWIDEEGKTMRQERDAIYGKNKQSQEGDKVSRGGLSRNDRHSEYGGANMFARIKRRREDKEEGLKRGRRRNKRNRRKIVSLARRIS